MELLNSRLQRIRPAFPPFFPSKSGLLLPQNERHHLERAGAEPFGVAAFVAEDGAAESARMGQVEEVWILTGLSIAGSRKGSPYAFSQNRRVERGGGKTTASNALARIRSGRKAARQDGARHRKNEETRPYPTFRRRGEEAWTPTLRAPTRWPPAFSRLRIRAVLGLGMPARPATDLNITHSVGNPESWRGFAT